MQTQWILRTISEDQDTHETCTLFQYPYFLPHLLIWYFYANEQTQKSLFLIFKTQSTLSVSYCEHQLLGILLNIISFWLEYSNWQRTLINLETEKNLIRKWWKVYSTAYLLDVVGHSDFSHTWKSMQYLKKAEGIGNVGLFCSLELSLDFLINISKSKFYQV